MRTPQFGEERRDVYLKAAEDIQPNLVLKRVTRPRFGVRLMRKHDAPERLVGVSLEGAKRGHGLWLRYYGATEAKLG